MQSVRQSELRQPCIVRLLINVLIDMISTRGLQTKLSEEGIMASTLHSFSSSGSILFLLAGLMLDRLLSQNVNLKIRSAHWTSCVLGSFVILCHCTTSLHSSEL